MPAFAVFCTDDGANGVPFSFYRGTKHMQGCLLCFRRFCVYTQLMDKTGLRGSQRTMYRPSFSTVRKLCRSMTPARYLLSLSLSLSLLNSTYLLLRKQSWQRSVGAVYYFFRAWQPLATFPVAGSVMLCE